KLDPESPAYNERAAMRIRGVIDFDGMAAALRSVAQRHEILRTVYVESDGRPFQVVRSDVEPRFEVFDLREIPDTARPHALRSTALDCRLRPCDLNEGPLLRLALLRVADDDTVMVYTAHHSVSDGWSVGVFVRDVTAAYNSIAAGAPPSLDPLPLQYADY